MAVAEDRTPKYKQVYAALRREILSGRLKGGDRLPSESELVGTFGASRITVGRAVRDLQQAGLVERRAGSGTYVKAAVAPSGLSFGLLIPDLGDTDIFEPICHGMMGSPLAREHALLWGSDAGAGTSKERWALESCQRYIERGVAGVFFAPLEHTPARDAVNARIVQAFDAARVPVVLLDRPVQPYPSRGRHDLVGIDNRRAGFVVTEHLLRLGCRRIAFIAMPNAAATVEAREAGYREALYVYGLPIDRALIHRLNPEDPETMRGALEPTPPDAIVCANDRTAGRVMHTLRSLSYDVPRDVRLTGVDDAEFATLLPVPLTTLRQPTREIGEAALAAMLERVPRRDLPARDIMLHAELVVRSSCGSAVAEPALGGSST